MNASFDPTVSSGTAASERLAQENPEQAKKLLLVGAGSVLGGFLLGYYICKAREQPTRQQIIENGIEEIRTWLRENADKLVAPLKESLEAAKSTIEVGLKRHTPSNWKHKRSFLNLF